MMSLCMATENAERAALALEREVSMLRDLRHSPRATQAELEQAEERVAVAEWRSRDADRHLRELYLTEAQDREASSMPSHRE